LINRDWVRPGLHGVLDVRADACLPNFHPLCAGKQRVGRTNTKSRLRLHTFRGPGATPHGQVLLSDWFRQTLLTTSLEVVQAIIYDRVLEAGI